MKQWDIWTFDFAEAGPHPAIIVSHLDRVARAPLVTVLIGKGFVHRPRHTLIQEDVHAAAVSNADSDWSRMRRAVSRVTEGKHSRNSSRG